MREVTELDIPVCIVVKGPEFWLCFKVNEFVEEGTSQLMTMLEPVGDESAALTFGAFGGVVSTTTLVVVDVEYKPSPSVANKL